MLWAALVVVLCTQVGSSSAANRSSLTVVSPTVDSVSGKIVWQVAASSRLAVDHVSFRIDNGPVSWTEYYAAYQFNGDPDGTLDTTTLANGKHTLTAVAFTSSGSVSAQVSRTVTVANVAPVPTPDTQPPSAPGTLTGSAVGSSQVSLSWGSASDNVGVSGYQLERCQGSGCSSFVRLASPAGSSYDDSGLAAGTSYSYRVRASDAAGNLGAYSNIATTTTVQASPPPPPPPPSSSGSLGG